MPRSRSGPPRHAAASGAFLCAALVLALWSVPPATGADQPSHALVRLWLDGRSATEVVRDLPWLDVAQAKPGVHLDVVADAEDLARLREAGLRLDVLHRDLEAHYRARIDPAKSDDFGIYHNWDEVVAFVDSLRQLHPEVVSARWSLGTSHEGRDIWCFRMSDNPDLDEDEPEVLFDALHHAREVMSSEFVILFAEHLAQQYAAGDPEIVHLLDTREVYFVPVVNPDGFVFNDWGEMWRKNRRDNGGGCWGVDPNRNYPYEWGGIGSSSDPCDDLYRGPYAGSEPEVQALMGLIDTHEFVTHNTYHTYGSLTLFPWGYTTDPTPDHATFERLGTGITRDNGYVAGQPGAVLYEVSGGTIDWAYGDQAAHPRIFSFSNEIGRGSDGFWPAESRRGDLFRENVWPAVYLMRVAGVFVAAQRPGVAGGDGNGRLDAGESAGLTFRVVNQSVAASAQNVGFTLLCDDPYVQLGEAERDVGALTPGMIHDLAADPVPVTVAAACPAGRIVTVTVRVSHDACVLDFPLVWAVGPETLIFADDLESGTGNWTLEGTWGTTTAEYSSPGTSLTDSPADNYADDATTAAILNGSYRATRLVYYQRHDLETDWDYGYVQVSADGGPWTVLEAFTGLTLYWDDVDIPLTDFAGQALQLRFQLVADTWINEDGWYLDDVALYGYDDDNQTPPPPALLLPAPGALAGPTPLLSVAGSKDPDGPGPLTYGFRVYADALGTQPAAAVDEVPESAGGASWTPPPLVPGTYWWRAYAADDQARGQLGEVRSFTVQDLSAAGELLGGPRLTALGPVAGGRARLRLDLPTGADVTLDLYDARGYRVRRLHAGALPAGPRVLTWDGRDGAGRGVASGVYLARLRAGRVHLTARLVLVR